MAKNELRFVETLDSSNFEGGIKQSTAAVRKLAEDTNLAAKGLEGMFDSDTFKSASQKFAGVSAAVKRFTESMKHELPIKREMRETQLVAQQLERVWRNLSAAEKQSAEGQELRAKIDVLIERGGVLRDTMGDVDAAMRFQASDTAKLDAVVGGIQALSAVAQVGAGAMRLLGASEEDAQKVQTDLMAVMSVVNGLQTIQNALQRESAVMQGMLAAKTAVLSAVTAAKAAAQKADTIATKAAAVAQWAWNAALSANPIGLVVAAVAALAAGVYLLTKRTKEATDEQKAEATTLKAVSTAQADAVKSTATASLELQMYREKVENFNGTAAEEKQLIEEINAKYGDHIGYITDLADAKAVLANNAEWYIKQLQAEAKATALASAYGEQYAKIIKGEVSYSEGMAAMEKLKGAWADVIDDAQFYASQIKISNNIAGRSTSRSKTTSSPRTSSRTSSRSHGSSRTSTASTAETLVTGSSAWFDAEISNLEALADKQADVAERNRILKKAAIVEFAKNVKFNPPPKASLNSFINSINEQLKNVTLKIPNIDIGFDPGPTAQERADEILEKTKGLRTAASAAAGAFRSLGDAIGGGAGKMVNVAGMLAQAIATMIQGYATATAQAANGFGPWGWIAFGLTGLAQLMAMISAVKSAAGFATGGIVGGSSYTGDRNLIRVNSGEMILNRGQQASLWNAINGGGIGGGQVQFRIQGQELVGVLRNYNSKMSKVR